jgi:hypothetical protein
MLEWWNNLLVVRAIFRVPMLIPENRSLDVLEKFRRWEEYITEPLEPWSECVPDGTWIDIEQLGVDAEVCLWPAMIRSPGTPPARVRPP